MLTPGLLRAATGSSTDNAALYAPHLAAGCELYQINTPTRLAAFLAQIGHESAGLAVVEESLNYTPAGLMRTFGRRISNEDAQRLGRIDGRKADQRAIANAVYGGEWGQENLGNWPGTEDGWAFRGQGLIQHTGRYNARRLTRSLRDRLGPAEVPDFEAEPWRLQEPRWAALSACDFWDRTGCNALADGTDFDALTRRINGGMNGADDRRRRWEMAKQALAEHPIAAPAPPASVEPAPAAAAPAAPAAQHHQTEWELNNPPAPEKPMPLPIAASLAIGLAQSLFTAFAPLAQEKLTKELGRHTDRPEVAAQISQAAVSAAMALTGKPDPVEAVMTAKADPVIIQQVQTSTLDELEKLAPLLERMAALDAAQFQAEEASREAAERRAQASSNDQDPFLTRSIVQMVVGILIGGAVLTGFLAWLKVDVQVILGALIALIGAVSGKFQTRYDHRYGSSAGSANKDAIRDAALSQIVRRP